MHPGRQHPAPLRLRDSRPATIPLHSERLRLHIVQLSMCLAACTCVLAGSGQEYRGVPPMGCPPSFLRISSPLFGLSFCRPSFGYSCRRWLAHCIGPPLLSAVTSGFLWLPHDSFSPLSPSSRPFRSDLGSLSPPPADSCWWWAALLPAYVRKKHVRSVRSPENCRWSNHF